MTEAEAEHSGFPIIGDVDRNGFTGRGPDLFASVAGQKLATVVPEARAAIERLQPFYEGPAWAFNPLWILNALARIDRHRFLHLAAIQSGSLRLDPAQTRNVKVEQLDVFTGTFFPEIEDRAELATITVHRANPQEKMKMRFLDALAIAFDTQDTEIPEVHGWDVGDVLSSCVTHTSIALDKLERYLPTP